MLANSTKIAVNVLFYLLTLSEEIVQEVEYKKDLIRRAICFLTTARKAMAKSEYRWLVTCKDTEEKQRINVLCEKA